MATTRTTIAVLGDGGWGTTLAIHLHRLGHRVRLWGAFPAYVRVLTRRRENPKFLPGIAIPQTLTITADTQEALRGAAVVVLAIPSQHLRSVLRKVPAPRARVVSVAKGLERGSLKRMSQVIAEEWGRVSVAALSGPNIAMEIAKGHPASSVVAAHDPRVAEAIQQLFMGDRFRLYTSPDVIGVELGGALKNPIAIAAGIGDGLGFGPNAKAALITRGVVEMARLGRALGAHTDTFSGLSGLGDLVTTCLAGRNRALGEQLGRGRTLKAVLAETPMVIEGVETTQAAVVLAKRVDVELPIIEQVRAVLFSGRRPAVALRQLMRRAKKPEIHHHA